MKIQNNFYNIGRYQNTRINPIKYSLNNNNIKTNNISFTSEYEDYDFSIFDLIQERQDRLYNAAGNPSTEYSKDEIAVAKKILDLDKTKRMQQNKQQKYEEIAAEEELRGSGFLPRAALCILTVGTSEIVNLTNKISDKRLASKWAQKIELIIADLLNAKANEEMADARRKKSKAQRELEFLSQMNSAKDDEIYPKLIDRIQARREGVNLEIPNCVMFSNPNDEINRELIYWTMSVANAQTTEIDAMEDIDLVDLLEQAEDDFQETNRWNVIYVKNMDKLINPKEVDRGCIASMKAIMCSCAEDNHTTLIFSCTNPDELDDAAIATNRVKKIDTDNIKSLRQMQLEEIDANLKSDNYLKNTPLAAINDFAEYVGLEEDKILTFYSTAKQVDETVETILGKLTEEQAKKYKPDLKQAQENAWYCI